MPRRRNDERGGEHRPRNVEFWPIAKRLLPNQWTTILPLLQTARPFVILERVTPDLIRGIAFGDPAQNSAQPTEPSINSYNFEPSALLALDPRPATRDDSARAWPRMTFEEVSAAHTAELLLSTILCFCCGISEL